MGVKGLWSLLEPVGHDTNLETMENKVLAIDVSIWLNQSIKGIRAAKDKSVSHAHSLGLFNKICKLLYYKIKPVFVFDGAVPTLKKQTIEDRSKSRAKILGKIKKNASVVLKSYLRQQLNQDIDFDDEFEEDHVQDSFVFNIEGWSSTNESDLFQLPPSSEEKVDSEEEIDLDFAFNSNVEDLHNIQNINIDSEDFKSLPASLRHEILTSMKEENKKLKRKVHLPQQSDNFSTFQMDRLLVRRKLQAKIEEAEDDINKQITETLTYDENDDIDYEQKLAQRVMSDENTHFVLLKKKSMPSIGNKLLKPSSKSMDLRDKPLTGESTKDIFEDISEFDFGKTEYMKTEGMSSLKSTISQRPKYYPKMKKEPELKSQDQVDTKESDFESSPILIKEEKIKAAEAEVDIHRKDVDEEKEDKYDEDIDEDDSSFEEVKNLDAEALDILYSSKIDSNGQKQEIVKLTDDDEKSDKIQYLYSEQSKLKSNKSPDLKDQIVNFEDQNKVSSQEKDSQTFSDTFSKEIKVNLEPTVIESLPQSSTLPIASSESSGTELSQKSITPQSSPLKQATESATPQSSPLVEKLKEQLNKDVLLTKKEKERLEREINKRERQTATVKQSMIQDCQELLSLFGIPYVLSPMEAEAQCAVLEQLGLTNGTITDDSDIWLFGGQTVFKNFFNQSKYVKMFNINDVKSGLKLDRELMICIALITGSDYTQGLEGAGPVMAMEILSEFEGKGIEKLIKFKNWWSSRKDGLDKSPGNKTRASFLRLKLNESFPNSIVYNAYLDPMVDNSKEKFTWGVPDLDMLRKYAFQKFNWSAEKVDSILLPVMKRVNDTSIQTRINDYFKRKVTSEQELFASKRLTKALDKFIDKQEKLASTTKKSQKETKTKHKTNKATKSKSDKKKLKTEVALSEDSSEGD